MSDDSYSTIRDVLGVVVGAKVVDITQHDHDEFQESGSRVYFHFDNGYTVSFPIGDEGFDISPPGDDDDEAETGDVSG